MKLNELKKKIVDLREAAIRKNREALAISEGKKPGELLTAAEAKQIQDLLGERDLLDQERERLESSVAYEEKQAGNTSAAPQLPVGVINRQETGDLDAASGIEAKDGSIRGYDTKGRPIFNPGPFATLGEQLLAIKNHFTHRGTDQRLLQVKASGANEEVFSEGGALLQPQFAYNIFTKAYEAADVAQLCRRFTISGNSNSLTVLTNDETDRSTGSRWGGVKTYWLAAAATPPANSKPKFGTVDYKLLKLMSLYYATDELLEDAAAIGSIAGQAVAEDMAWHLAEGIIAGSGAGMPMGMAKCSAKIAITKESGQTADTVVAQNISKMWARLWAPSRPTAIWLINQDVEPQLDLLALTVGLGGLPIYMPPGGIADAPYGRLKGRPVHISEHMETLGDAADIGVFDPQQYGLADKGGVRSDLSIHVAFTTDESCFRFTYRADGRPLWKSALTPAKGSSTLSPFIVLGERA